MVELALRAVAVGVPLAVDCRVVEAADPAETAIRLCCAERHAFLPASPPRLLAHLKAARLHLGLAEGVALAPRLRAFANVALVHRHLLAALAREVIATLVVLIPRLVPQVVLHRSQRLDHLSDNQIAGAAA